MSNEFLVKKGLISQGNATVTGSVNITDHYIINGNVIAAYNTSSFSYFYGSLPNNFFTLSGTNNTGVGDTLSALTTANSNCAFGVRSLFKTSVGSYNTAMGAYSMYENISGAANVAVGSNALRNNRTGSGNTAIGNTALQACNGGDGNTSIGYLSLNIITTGGGNTSIGYNSLGHLETGSNNTAIGIFTGTNLISGSGNILIGRFVNAPLSTSDNQLNIGNLIYGTGLNGTYDVISTGKIGLGVKAPVNRLDVNGNISCSYITASFLAGSSSYSDSSLSASYALSSSYAFNTKTADTASYLTPTNNYTITELTASGTIRAAIDYRINNDVVISADAANNNYFYGVKPDNFVAGIYGQWNTSVGYALKKIASGSSNTAIGDWTLLNTTTGSQNTAVGQYALTNNTVGNNNTALGMFALSANASGSDNTAIGYNSTSQLKTGSYNVSVGSDAGNNIQTGSRNICIGAFAHAASTSSNNQLNIGNLIYGISLDGTYDTISSGNIGLGVKNPVNRLDVNGNISCSYITASFIAGTSSYASSTLSASYALSSSYSLSSSYALSSSYSLSSSYALSASYYGGSVLSSSFSLSASYAVSSSLSTNSLTASYSENAENTEHILLYVKNNSGTILPKGTVCRIVDVDNSANVSKIDVADYRTESGSANTIGLLHQSLGVNQFGYIITEGYLSTLDTSTFTSGDVLYLSSSGTYTNIEPTAPYHGVRLGQVIRIQNINGSIYVRIDNGQELGESHDVVDSTSSGSYGDLLIKSGNIWINSKTLTGSYILSGSFTTNAGIVANSVTASFYGTSSWSTNSLTASSINFTASNAIFAQTASYVTASLTTTASYLIPTNSYNITNLTASGNISSSGTVTALAIAEQSTRTIKNNIYTLPAQLDTLMKLNPVSFTYKYNNEPSIGFIAEEVADVYPEFTSHTKDSVYYSKITSVLVKSVQELNLIIEKQQTQIDELKKQLNK